jgi:serine/threonine-protein kinase/endoribonuclease IRE1
VYRGSFQGRAVAVKRLLQDFVTVASREVALLQESDDHPNVIRYYYQESRNNFLYIALELCPASLEDILHRPNVFPEIAAVFQPKKALSQITAGLRHLHSLKIVHRDIKPQNILVSQAKNGMHRMLISDFGLCKKLGTDETSFLPTRHGPLGAGTVGWRAPEILRGEVDLDVSTIDSLGSIGQDDNSSTVGSLGGVGINSGSGSGKENGNRTRLTKSVDIFALGCLLFYTLTCGEHPFGGPFDRESNILKDEKDLSWLERLGEEGEEASDLISKMLNPQPKLRYDNPCSCLSRRSLTYM